MTSEYVQIQITELEETLSIAQKISQCVVPKLRQLQKINASHKTNNTESRAKLTIYFSGNLGAGKTALIRSLLKASGVEGFIKSPTYSLVETYQIEELKIVHIDAYRLQDEHDFFSSGLDESLNADWVMIEWYEKIEQALPPPDWIIRIKVNENIRVLTIQAQTDLGKALLRGFLL